MMTALLYGDSPFTLNSSRYYATVFGNFRTANAQNIIDAGGRGQIILYLLVCWEDSLSWYLSEGKQGGLSHQDLARLIFGIPTVTISVVTRIFGNGKSAVVKDWRYIVRICKYRRVEPCCGSSAADLIKLMIKAMYRVFRHSYLSNGIKNVAATGGGLFLMATNPCSIATGHIEMLHIQSFWISDFICLNRAMMFTAVRWQAAWYPIRTCDQMLLTEKKPVTK